jgi:hypothetical protein
MTTTETKTELSVDQQAWLRDAGAMLAFLEKNPDLWGPYTDISVYHPVWSFEHDDVLAVMGDAARRLAPCDKEAGENTSGGDFHLTKRFGAHSLTIYTKRENVCEKRVVGTETKEVEALSDEDQALVDSLPKIAKTVEVEKVEWVCPSLLAHG